MQWNNTDVNNYATSTIHNYLNNTYCNTLPTQDREKLGTKAVREEFHGIRDADNVMIALKQKYGWDTLNSNVWLPSLIELVGIDPNIYDDTRGCYYSAMRGLNTSNIHYTDAQGGIQWNYFVQYNASGGGQRIWDICNRKPSWLRSVNHAYATNAWRTTDAFNLNTSPATESFAVHPAVLYNP